MILSFIGADHEVTGSCHSLQACGKNLLIDCGMEQGEDVYENQELPVNAADIDFVLLTHAHIDHTGLLPLLYAQGFRGQVYATIATCDLCDIMLRDSAHIQMMEAEWRNRKAKRSGKEEYVPLYEMKDVLGVLPHFMPCAYDEQITLCEGIRIRFSDVGHLLGSASIEIWAQEQELRKIVFSGDIGNINKPLLRDPKYLTEGADYVVMESTYGDRIHEVHADYVPELAKIVKETFDKGGNVVIPSFAVGRTQEMLYYFRRIKSERLLPEYPDFEVYLDSPLAVDATEIFHKNYNSCFSEDALEMIRKGNNPITFSGLRYSITSDDSKLINEDARPKVIISASGMCEAGRIRHHLKHNLWRPECTVLFVGYQAHNTLGRALVDGAQEVRLFGENIEVKARVVRIEGLSGHADKNGLLRWLAAMQPRPTRVFVVHGEDSVCDSFAEELQELGYTATAPYTGSDYDLISDTCIGEGLRQRRRKKPQAKQANKVFARLIAAGQRLLQVISRNEGGANKDLARFADQVNALCDKWER